mmetsp:Transcript_24098/g.56213  ORF Transcript_24098/g.56213 Transcript_24098/m.56213 type:complete len:91 (-) Transcript_24098:311-583(-)
MQVQYVSVQGWRMVVCRAHYFWPFSNLVYCSQHPMSTRNAAPSFVHMDAISVVGTDCGKLEQRETKIKNITMHTTDISPPQKQKSQWSSK